MQLTINTEDLSSLTIQSSTGEVYRLVKDSTLKDVEAELEGYIQASRRQIVSQNQLMKDLGIGWKKLQSWVAEGLGQILDGESIYYDLQEVYEFRRAKRI